MESYSSSSNNSGTNNSDANTKNVVIFGTERIGKSTVMNTIAGNK